MLMIGETYQICAAGLRIYTFSYSAYATSSRFCQYRHNLLERFQKKKDMKLYVIIQIISTFFVSTVLGVDEIGILTVDVEEVL